MPEQAKPIQIIANQDHQFIFHEEELARVLNAPNVVNTKVAVVSVAGAFRKGKSFLLDFFIRYFTNRDSENWLGDEHEPLKGFSWRAGAERETTGIWIWDHPFIITGPTGESIAVILVDTQGTFDAVSTVRDNATIFGLSTLISSVQIYNLSQNIQEDHLQQLQLFSEYGQLAASGELGSDPNAKAFQTLMVLVRDWTFTKDYPLGEKGGNQYLEKILQISDSQHPDLKSVREHIKSSFENMGCFLLPHPGLDVVENLEYDGRAADLRATFREKLKELVEAVFVRSLPVKKINGEEITCGDLLHYIRSYIKIYQSNELPEPKTALQATAEANNLASKEKAMAFYTSTMDVITAADYILPTELWNRHLESKAKAVEVFQKVKKLGGATYSAQYQAQLETLIDDLFPKYHRLNDMKAAYITPVILGVSLTIAFLLSCSKADYLLESFWLNYSFILVPLDLLFWTIAFITFFYMLMQWKRNQFRSFEAPLRVIDGGAHQLNKQMRPIVNVAQRAILEQMLNAATGPKPKIE